MDLDGVADELYSLTPEEFTAARNEREKQAKDAGDADLAKQIRQLSKPNQVAWLANQLAREHADAVEPLLELGAALREATANLSGEQLRTLSKQQHQLVHALVQQAKRLASAGGKRVSEDTARGLEDTFRAALADEAAAGQLIAGRLTTGLQQTGFGSGAAPAGGAQRPTSSRPPKPATAEPGSAAQRHADALDRANRDVEQAADAEQGATEAREQAESDLDLAEHRATDMAADVERLREQLGLAIEAQSQADRDQRAARKVFDRADRAARDAQLRLADATDRRDRLAQE